MVSGRARPEIAKARNTHKCTDILRFFGVGNYGKAGNVEMCYLFCFKRMLQMRILRNLENHDFHSNSEVAFGPAKHTTSCTFRVSKDAVGRKTNLRFFHTSPGKLKVSTAPFSQKSLWRTGFIKGNPTRIFMSAETEPWLFDFQGTCGKK